MTKSFTLHYGDHRIPYRVQEDLARSSRIAIHVDSDGTVLVDAPPGVTDHDIQSAVQKRARWITTQTVEATRRFAHVQPREYVSGEQILYLGRRYILKIIITTAPSKIAKLKGNRLEIESKTGEPEAIRGHMRAWYRTKARAYFAHRLDQQSAKLPWVETTPSFRLLDMSRQWGSCSPTGQIILNPHLIKTPRACIDYVIIHELAHLKHHNHGPEFTAVLNQTVPDWETHKRQLDQMVEVVMNE